MSLYYVIINRNDPEAGFTLLEVLVAIGILTVGLMSAVLLTTATLGTTRQSKYMSMATVFASEKLEDLNRWGSDDPEICVPTGSTSTGSLTSDTAPSILCPGAVSSTTVNYYDDVFLGETNDTSICPGGASSCFTETVSSVSNGSTVYTTTSHAPNGIITTSTSSTAPAATTFHRRWIIEQNAPVTGVRRITVLVTLTDASVQAPITFQMSIVRP
jgi:prepilin-type N-terminal cleavage/methylation domain-containing protein